MRQALARLAASDDGCHYLISEIEYLSKKVQRDLGFDSYRSPILAGVGAGATLAYAALAQALATRVGLCAGAPASAAAGGGFRYDACANLPGKWRVSAAAPTNPWQGFAVACGAAGCVPTEGPLETRLIPLVEELLPAGAPDASDRLRNLPLIEYPAAGKADTLHQLPPDIVQCFYGEEEEDTLCRAADLAGLEAISTTGSHHFDGDYAALAERILVGRTRRRAARLPPTR